ncbi:MAG: hypothetical protein NC121_14705 [Blautia sp.]|nr:hypothetical protein [Blautia sp.]
MENSLGTVNTMCPGNGTWKEFAAAFCADGNFFPAKGVEVKRAEQVPVNRNWNREDRK